MKTVFAFLALLSSSFGITNVTLPYIVDTASIPKIKYVDKNDSALKWGINNLGDTVNGATGSGALVRKNSPSLSGTPAVAGNLTVDTNVTVGKKLIVTDSARIPRISSAIIFAQIATYADSILGASARFTGNLKVSKLTGSDSVIGTIIKGTGGSFSGEVDIATGSTTKPATLSFTSNNAFAIGTNTTWRTADILNPATTSNASAGIAGVVGSQAVGGIVFKRSFTSSDKGGTSLLYGNGSGFVEGLKLDSTGAVTIPGNASAARFTATDSLKGVVVQVNGSGGAAYGACTPANLRNTTSSANNAEEITFQESNGNYIASIAGVNTVHNSGSSTAAGALAFLTKATGVGTYPAERMRIHPNGNISINSSTDNGYALEVTGAAHVTGNFTADSLISAKTHLDTSFTVTLTGVSGSVTGTAYASKSWKTVTLTLPELFGTSNSTSCTITGIIAPIRPSRDIGLVGLLIGDNGASLTPGSSGTAYLNSSGVITLYKSGSATGFTNVNNKGIWASTAFTAAQTFTYTLQ